jgi:tetratricopeptide (TPR) repeat protein
LAVLIACIPLNGQQAASTVLNPKTAVSAFPNRAELLRLISLYENAARNAEAAHWQDPRLADVYLHLGGMYQDVAMYLKAEDALNRAVALLRDSPADKLADALDHLARLHTAMGDLRKAATETHEALELRELDENPVGVATSMSSIAQLNLKQGHLAEAEDDAQRAMDVLGNDPAVDVSQRIAVRQLLADILCRMHECEQAVPLLQQEVALARENFGASSLPVALALYHLGFAYSQTGDFTAAEVWMARGTEGMRPQFGWGHPIYLEAMRQYARLLRQRGDREAASTAETEIRRASSIVDARSFTSRGQ